MEILASAHDVLSLGKIPLIFRREKISIYFCG